MARPWGSARSSWSRCGKPGWSIGDRLKKAPGFQGHWSGASGTDHKVIELWESPEAYMAWIDGTIKPNLPPGVQLADPEFIDLALAVEPG